MLFFAVILKKIKTDYRANEIEHSTNIPFYPTLANRCVVGLCMTHRADDKKASSCVLQNAVKFPVGKHSSNALYACPKNAPKINQYC